MRVGVLGKYFQQITKKMDFKTTHSFKDFWFSIISFEAEAFYKYLSSGEEFVLWLLMQENNFWWGIFNYDAKYVVTLI